MTDICNMKKIFSLVILPFLLLIGKFGLAQNCNDWIKNSGELKIDCGGPDCVPCLQLNYNVQCKDTGLKHITLYFPVTDDYLYAISGHYYEPEFIPAFNNYQINMMFADPETFKLRVVQKDLLSNTVSQTIIEDGVLACSIFSDDYECPASSDLAVQYEMIECNADAGTFYLHIDINGGVAPFQITNDTLENLYYDADFEENSINIGSLHDGEPILFSLIDSRGCVEHLFLTYDFSSCQITGTISGLSAAAPPSIAVIPYPSQRRFEILISDPSENWFYHLYSISGQLIQEGKMDMGNGSSPGYISYPTQAAGIHFLTLENGKQKFAAKYLLNNH